MNTLGFTINIIESFDAAVERVTEMLGTEGFGVISRIDLDNAFREKLNLDFRRYTILGACNPSLAHAAVSTAPEVGLLLPCNVTVEETDSGACVRIVDAAQMMPLAGIEGDNIISELGVDAGTRLKRVAAKLEAG